MWVSFSGHNGVELLDISGLYLYIEARTGDSDAIVDYEAYYETIAHDLGSKGSIVLHSGPDFTVAENVLLRIQAGLSSGAKIVKIHS